MPQVDADKDRAVLEYERWNGRATQWGSEDDFYAGLTTLYPEPKYQLRAGPRQPEKLITTWLDEDKSGDYDPEKEGQPLIKLNVPKRRLEGASSGTFSDASRIKRPKVVSHQYGRLLGRSHPITFRLESTKGKELQQNLGTTGDNWPLVDGQLPYKNVIIKELTPEPFDNNDYADRYRLRQRAEDLNCNDDISDGKDVVSELHLGHPAARGCKNCISLALECPLLNDNNMYPCLHCLEDGIDCELVMPPLKKRACERCRKVRRPCSYYLNDQDHDKPCTACSASGVHPCVAGPKSGKVRTGPSYNVAQINPVATQVADNRKTVSCTPCRRDKKRCTLRSKEDFGPCKYCKQNDSSCTFEDLPRKNPSKKDKSSNKVVRTQAVEDDDRREDDHEQDEKDEKEAKDPPVSLANIDRAAQSILPETRHSKRLHQDAQMLLTALHGAVPTTHQLESKLATLMATIYATTPTTTIITNFSHPIIFNHPEESSALCDFCVAPVYGILGLGERTVTVTACGYHQGYIERNGGHRSEGRAPTKMCQACACSRMYISRCGGHQIEKIEGLDPETFDEDAAFATLDSANPNATMTGQGDEDNFVLWCSVCPNPAFYGCSAVQKHDAYGEAVDPNDEDSRGCGLFLCGTCATLLSSAAVSGLDELMEKAKTDEELYPTGLRADAYLLQKRGPLQQFYEACAEDVRKDVWRPLFEITEGEEGAGQQQGTDEKRPAGEAGGHEIETDRTMAGEAATAVVVVEIDSDSEDEVMEISREDFGSKKATKNSEELKKEQTPMNRNGGLKELALAEEVIDLTLSP